MYRTIRFRRITHTLAYNSETYNVELSHIVTARVILPKLNNECLNEINISFIQLNLKLDSSMDKLFHSNTSC